MRARTRTVLGLYELLKMAPGVSDMLGQAFHSHAPPQLFIYTAYTHLIKHTLRSWANGNDPRMLQVGWAKLCCVGG